MIVLLCLNTPSQFQFFPGSMLFVLTFFASSLQQCTPDITYLANGALNATIPAKSWFFFYSHYIDLKDTLTVRLRPFSGDVKLYQGSGLMCPSDDNDPILTAQASSNQFFKHDFHFEGAPELAIFGIKNDNDGDVNTIVSVIGNNPNTKDRSIWVVLTSLFLALCFVLLIMLFVHAILARGRVHYQVEVDE